MPAVPRVDRLKTIYSSAKALNYGWRFTDIPRTPVYNGVSRYIPQLHRIPYLLLFGTITHSYIARILHNMICAFRITFRFCKQSEGSVGVRNFIEHKLLEFGIFLILYLCARNMRNLQTACFAATKEPSVVIYTQPVRNTNPVIRAEYGNGRIIQLNAKNMTMEEVVKDVHLLYSRSGLPVVKFESLQSAVSPSVQGEWSPMTWLSPRMNTANLPDPEFSRHKTTKLIDLTMTKFHVPRSTRIIRFWKALPHYLLKNYPEQTIVFSTFGLAGIVITALKFPRYGDNIFGTAKPYYRGYYDVVRPDDPIAINWRKPEDYPPPYLTDGIDCAR
ncbi:hypothetical protein DICVIV_02682 [Dictyocaulus viviparus]|uniref:Large ribosomal subunit protein mL43 n=1 Tax=Dictyocaulus viviparus TaxID=29172 RepID=A0A0D8Y2L7_DICVI|nr:hypothetical protein DICVIV_02682 [Dictyocaulus viviparus]